ncbi:MAG: sensor histidine kinase/response regulator [Hyphomonadaceae bacterium]|nr:MAG: sensor histidine kinase/response regulator [Hyphomonadaceae bacterium]
MSESEIEKRLKFLDINEGTKTLLRDMAPFIESALPNILTDFYSVIVQWPELARFYTDKLAINSAKSAQLRHWGMIFTGTFSDDYVASVRRIGETHARIGLKPQWYIGGYAIIVAEVSKFIMGLSAANGALANQEELNLAKQRVEAFSKASMLDMDFALSVYFDESEKKRTISDRRHAELLEKKIEARTRDLEAAKKAAEAADFAKSSFLAQMSHEIRTPMNGVIGVADALARTELNSQQQALVAIIKESGDTLLTLLNDVLDLAKIESGRMELERINFNVVDVVRSSEAIFSARAQEKGLSFSVSIEIDENTWCVGDPTRLRQILFNLISNAIKFTDEGEVNVQVGNEATNNDEALIKFTISDTGIGMDEAGVLRLFEKFSQADVSTTRKFGGSGLGLSICREFATLMNGKIEVISAPAKGSIFTLEVTMPIGKKPSQTEVGDLVLSSECCEDLRILAAEDNPNNRLVLKMFLEQVGIVPVFVENGQLAVEAWKAQDFDVILMDVQMPVMSGLEAAAEIRKLEKATSRHRTPIIALTANAMSHHVHECLSAGMDAHVAKPIRPDLLFSTLERCYSTNEKNVSELTEIGSFGAADA